MVISTPLRLRQPSSSVAAATKISPSTYSTTVIQSFLEPDKQEFCNIVACFAYQARKEKRLGDFLNQVMARFHTCFPERYDEDLPARVAINKEKLRTTLKSASFHRRLVLPVIHWENMLAVSPEDFALLGTAIIAQAKEAHLAAMKVVPTLRQLAAEAEDEDTMPQSVSSPIAKKTATGKKRAITKKNRRGKQAQAQDIAMMLKRASEKRVQPAAIEVATCKEDPEGPTKVLNLRSVFSNAGAGVTAQALGNALVVVDFDGLNDFSESDHESDSDYVEDN